MTLQETNGGIRRVPLPANSAGSERRLELFLLVLFFVGWLAAVVLWVASAPLAGIFQLGLYHLYGVAAVLGWLAGNIYVYRSRGTPKVLRRRLLLIYLLGPPGLLYLLWSTAPLPAQQAAPLASVYSCVVFAILFLVPVTFARSGSPNGRSTG